MAYLVAHTRRQSSLVRLVLSSCKIGEAGARALLEAPHLERVRSLDLSFNDEIPATLQAPLQARFGHVDF
jgi:hypothetical protein